MDPGVDVSAALAAAVAAAAEIAKNGFETGMFLPTENAVTANAPASSEARNEEAPNPQSEVTAAAPSQEHQSEQPVRERAASSASDQYSGEDASGDITTEKHNNDLSSVNSSENVGFSPGEKTFEETEEDAARRLARSRERNREHARRTRLRKKAQLEALQSKVRGLQAEKRVLKQKIEECSIASILVGLAEPDQEEQQDDTVNMLDDTIKNTEKKDQGAKISMLTTGKRKRFASVHESSEENKPVQPLKIKIDGEIREIGPKSHINWKSGVYSDEDGVQRQLTSEQLESLR